MYGPFPCTMSYAQKEVLGIDFIRQLKDGETITGVSLTVTDSSGASVSSMVDGSASINGTIVQATKGANRGTRGSTYYWVFTATTSTGRVLGGDGSGTIKMKIKQART